MVSQKSTKAARAMDHNLERDYDSIVKGARSEMSEPALRYMRCVIDPRRAKPSGIPTLAGGEPGWTGTLPVHVDGEITVGTAGFGFLEMGNPITQGFYHDNLAATYSDSVYSLNVTSLHSTGLPGQFGQPIHFDKSPYQIGDDAAFRMVGFAVEVFPDSSLLDQNGRILFVEYPDHFSGGTKSFLNGSAYEESRIIRAISKGDPNVKNVLNVHPRSDYNGAAGGTVSQASSNPFQFQRIETGVSTSMQSSCADRKSVV